VDQVNYRRDRWVRRRGRDLPVCRVCGKPLRLTPGHAGEHAACMQVARHKLNGGAKS
jgi:hypothetical protein